MAVFSGLEDMDELEAKKQHQHEQEGTVNTQYHHGRCDVGSPWSKGTVRNFGCD